MPKYLLYDPTAPSPQRIDGAFDTDLLNYPRLPPKERLLEVSDEEWANYLAWHPWVKIQDGKVFDSDPNARAENLARISKNTPWLLGHEDLGTLEEHHEFTIASIRSGLERGGVPLPPLPPIPGIPFMHVLKPSAVVGHVPPPVALDPKPPTGPVPPEKPPENKPTPVPDPLGKGKE